MKQAWEQQENEPTAAFIRFLVYRNLGPGRSLVKAHAMSISESTKKHQYPPVPGQWRQDCVTYEWVARAHAWDIHNLETVGQQATIKYVAAIERVLDRTLNALEHLEPQDWQTIMATLRDLAQFMTPEVFAAMRSARDEQESASN